MSEEERVQFKFMIPSNLKAKLEDAAHEKRRSLSAEIVARLEQSFPDGSRDNSKDEFANDMFRALINAAKGDRRLLDTYLDLAQKTVDSENK